MKTPLDFGRAPSVPILGGESVALRRRGSRWRLRDWRLRTKLTAVLLVPLVLAGVLSVLRVTDLVGEARDLDALQRQIGFAQQVSLVVHGLQGERLLVAEVLGTGGAAGRAALTAQVKRVDDDVNRLRSVAVGADGNADPKGIPPSGESTEGDVYRAALDRLSGLAALRRSTVGQATLGSKVAVRDAVAGYSGVITGLLDINRAVLDGAREPLMRQADSVTALGAAKEQGSLQHAVLLAAILSGNLPADQQAALRTADAQFDAAINQFEQAASPAQRQLYPTTGAVVERKRLLDAALDRAVRAAPLDTVAGDWNSAAVGTVEGIRQAEFALLGTLRADIAVRSEQARGNALWVAAAIVALLALTVLMLAVVVRSLLLPLRTLRTAAFDVADRQLPEVVEQLRLADGTSLGQTTVEPVPVHSREEVGQVARALDTVHVQAVRLAAEQAVLRSSLNDTFLNLAGRSQGLVERQRQLIDELESKEQDPELRGGLAQLDQLATRMRRHSENQLVLAGGNLGSADEQRVAVLDVLRSAVAEVEQNRRVTLQRPPVAMVAGPVVNDLVHLIAELLDNATSVAPQETMVTLGSALTEDEGLLVEIADSGPGLPPDELQAVNVRLTSPPVVDVSVSRQLGLFVVGRLAARHDITVRLRRRSGNIGIIAEVMLPPALVSMDSPVSAGPLASMDGASAAPVTTEWSKTDVQLPMQISVIDEATAADLFSPASIGIVTPRPSRPRTAEEEWMDLFGHDEPQPRTQPQSLPQPRTEQKPAGPVSSGFPVAPVPAGSDPLASQVPPGCPATAAGRPQEVHEEIFEMVSAWFQERQSAPVSRHRRGAADEVAPPPTGFPSPVGEDRTPPPASAYEWRSPMDQGWDAAQTLRTPVDHGVTRAGLPKRQPRAHLVPGVDGVNRMVPTPVPASPVRTPDDVRGRLSRYQRGLRVGRHVRLAPDQPSARTGTQQERFEED